MPFHHDALFYSGSDGFLAGTLPFLRDGIEGGEAILVVVETAKVDALQAELGPDAAAVTFTDMGAVGANPARIIPAWRDFVDQYDGTRQMRGIGEPVSLARSPEELVECQHHEILLNVAFADSTPWRLLCPYDTSWLTDDVLHEARRSHPFVVEGGVRRASEMWRDLDAMQVAFGEPLVPPPDDAEAMRFPSAGLGPIRDFVASRAERFGCTTERSEELALAVSEVATNSVLHGGGTGVLALWAADGRVVCEIRDHGRIRDPLVGRVRPPTEYPGGRGLWLANQLCDLVQIRTGDDATTIRLHVKADR